MSGPTIVFPKRRQERGDTAAVLAAANEVLMLKEICIETDTGIVKIGDGSTPYNSLMPLPGRLTAPGADRLLFWDDSANKYQFLTLGTNLSISGSTLNATSGGGAGAWTTVKKVADETRSADSTLADDSTLLVALSAGVRYRIRIDAFYRVANATMDFKDSLTYTGTVTGTPIIYRNLHFPDAGIGTSNESTSAVESALPFASNMLSGNAGIGRFRAEIVILTATAGTFSFQWAQNTSNAGDLTVLAGSFLEYATF